MSAYSSAASPRLCSAPGSPSGFPRGSRRMTLKNKIVSADEAIAIIRDGDTICVSGFVGIGTPDELIIALGRRFLKEGHPSRLTLVFAAAPGDGTERGLSRLAHRGLLKRVVGGHWSLVPKIAELALENAIEAYNLPLGCISHLYREIAAHRPGTISKVGLRTFVDPRDQGGKLNSVTTEDLVELLEIDGEEWLRSKRQHHYGAGGAYPRQSRFCDGSQELPRLRHSASRAHCRRGFAQSARGPGPRHFGRLCGVGRSEEPPPDLRLAL